MKTKNILMLLICLSFTWGLHGQSTISGNSMPWQCGFDDQYLNSIGTNTLLLQQHLNYENSLVYKSGGPSNPTPQSAPYTIPVVFHIIQNTSAPVTITYDQILWQLASLNASYGNYINSMYGDTPGQLAVNTQIRFCLAKTVMGPTQWSVAGEYGVMRYTTNNNAVLGQVVSNPTSQSALLAMTHPNSTYFPFNRVLNIWCVPNICSSGPCGSTGNPTTIGYATFPTVSPTFDGVVMRLDAIGDNYYQCNGFSSMTSQLNRGRILAHEIGHYLGLYHTFETCVNSVLTGSATACYGVTATTSLTDGDMIFDTPPTNAVAYQGPPTPAVNTCNEVYAPYTAYGNTTVNMPDQVENFMSYNDDDYMTTFTANQRDRMWGALDLSWGLGLRSNLTDANNLSYTGVTTAPACGSGVTSACFNYTVNPGSTCNSISVTFVAPTGPDIPYTYSWNLGDGTLTTQAAFTHTYTNITSNITVSLVATNTTNGTAVTTTSVLPFSQNSAGFTLNSSTTMCRGSEASITIHFDGMVKPCRSMEEWSCNLNRQA